MCVFGIFKNGQSAFLGLKQRRNCEPVPKWSVFGAHFEYFEPLFSKNDLFFAKIVWNYALFDNFEKERVVFALSRKIRTYSDFQERKIRTYG